MPAIPVTQTLVIAALRRRCVFKRDAPQLFSGEPHRPVVYFARVGRNVKIGTTKNLQARMLGLYMGPEDVMGAVPGDRSLESVYHQRFASARLQRPGRTELFRLNWRLRLFLSRGRCRWTESAACLGLGCGAAVATGWFALGILVFAGGTVACVLRPGWEHR